MFASANLQSKGTSSLWYEDFWCNSWLTLLSQNFFTIPEQSWTKESHLVTKTDSHWTVDILSFKYHVCRYQFWPKEPTSEQYLKRLWKLKPTYFLIVKISNFLSIEVRFLKEGDRNQKITQMSNQASEKWYRTLQFGPLDRAK